MAKAPSAEIMNNARNIEFAKHQRIVPGAAAASPDCTILAILEWLDKKFPPEKESNQNANLFAGADKKL